MVEVSWTTRQRWVRRFATARMQSVYLIGEAMGHLKKM
jgi:hypothetical protein